MREQSRHKQQPGFDFFPKGKVELLLTETGETTGGTSLGGSMKFQELSFGHEVVTRNPSGGDP